MMLDAARIVRDLAPGLLGDRRASVACVCTTRPKYLVFNGDESLCPACIVEHGDPARLVKTERILSALSSRMPGMVPAVITCAPWRHGQYVLIQEGLPGTPWFRVADRVSSAAEWQLLLTRAAGAMVRLHEVVRDVREWTAMIPVGVELQRQASIARATGVPLAAPVWRRVGEWAASAGDRPVRSHRQHGDFSLNNLLVGRDGLAIIDFDEFGSTAVPLHDAFGLALSFTLAQAAAPPLSRLACISECVARAAAVESVDRRHLPALLLHHLLFRINEAAGLHRRARLRRILIDWTAELARAPEQFLA